MPRVRKDDLENFCQKALKAAGVREDVAHYVAEGLTQASLRGVDSHGVRLLPHYLKGVKAGRLNPAPDYKFNRTAPATGSLDADHTFGHAAGAEGMRRAMALAREAGMGAVTVFNSSHYGAAAYFALMAAREGMLGFSFTHADSLLVSYGGKKAYFGTNPICLAAPVEGEEPFCLDMAPTTTTWNKAKQLAEEGSPIPEGWVVDGEGQPTTDPARMAALLPIGRYKGYGITMMVEILCGLLTGMPFGAHISSMFAAPMDQKRFLGHFFMALDISRFQETGRFTKRMRQMVDEVRSQEPLDPGQPVMVAGDPEKLVAKERLANGVPLSDVLWRQFMSLEEELGLGGELAHE